MSPDRELFVICPECGNEASPYVTECPYCGHRLRKRAPDLKKQQKREEKHERKRSRRGRRASIPGDAASWLDPPGATPVATIALIALATVASIVAISGPTDVKRWMLEHLVFTGGLGAEPWKLVTAPLLQYSFGYGFVCLFAFAIFGIGLERRFGSVSVVVLWLVCGALGVLAEALIADPPLTFGAYAIAAGAVLGWSLVAARNEELGQRETIGLATVAFVLCMLPLATLSARVTTLTGGVAGGLLCGLVLSRMPMRR